MDDSPYAQSETVSSELQFSSGRGSSLQVYFSAIAVGENIFVIWETMNLQAHFGPWEWPRSDSRVDARSYLPPF